MAKHILTGKEGERLAIQFLKTHGYTVLHSNWRYSHYEIDLIAWKTPVLHFVEIKTRRNYRFGYPEESVTVKKMKNLMSAANEFLSLNPHYKQVQYDILSITLHRDTGVEFFLLEDVYYYGNDLSK